MNRIQILLGLALLIVLSIRFYLYSQNQIPYHDNEKIEFTTTLLSEPAITIFNQKISLETQRGSLQIILSKYPEYHYGDSIKITGSIISKASTQKGRVLSKKKIVPTVYYPHITLVKNDTILLKLASSFRQNVILLFQKNISSSHSALLLGIVFGIKEPMDKSFTDSLRIAGVFHVIAASGMNVTMVSAFLGLFFSLFLHRKIALFVTILLILFYAIVSGLQASILRASIMGILVLAAQILGRQTFPVFGLCIAGYGMLLVNPSTLFDVGFQLSFASSFGLLFILPQFRRSNRISTLMTKSIVGEDLASTLSAQIATLPILLSTFGSYSPFSIIANTLVLWTVPILMIFGGLAAVIGILFEPIGRMLLYFCLPFLWYFEFIISWFGKHVGAFSFTSISWQMSVGYYLIVGSIILFLRQ